MELSGHAGTLEKSVQRLLQHTTAEWLTRAHRRQSPFCVSVSQDGFSGRVVRRDFLA